jgi:uncharacterized membrane protein YjfL (UPF0719 family)
MDKEIITIVGIVFILLVFALFMRILKELAVQLNDEMAVSAISLAIVIGSIALGLLMTAGITKND